MNNIILIGMPGCGKSTVGVVLAKALGMKFIDSDLVIQETENRLLSEIIAKDGLESFLKTEERINSTINAFNCVIATGGSAVYGNEAIKHFKSIGKIVYIKLPYEEIVSRLGDLSARGVAIKDGQTLRDLYEERVPLYESCADYVIDAYGKDIKQIVSELKQIR